MNTPSARLHVREFNAAFSPPADPDFWAGLVREETEELKDSILNTLKEIVDVAYTSAGYLEAGGDTLVVLEFMKELRPFFALLERIADGDSDLLEAALDLVHQSNMSKLGDDGQPVRREDGKVLKGPNYAPPDLSKLL